MSSKNGGGGGGGGESKRNVVSDGQEMNEHMKAMWAGQSNILVAVRVRPLMKHDQVKKSCVRTLETNVVVIMDPASGDKHDILRANRSREKQYAFDHVFSPDAQQESCYLHTAKFLIHGVLDGYNATVFAYGQTGSGKTYTMIGTEREPGIMVRVMEDLFRRSAQQGQEQGVQFKTSVSFLEVYNENIRDLLSDVEEYLDLREDPIKGPVVASITEIETTSSKQIMELLHQGNAKRSQAATAANEASSRSHAVLQVVVESRDRAPGTVANIKVGKLSLVDLAGSERAANTKNRGARLVEGANINRSLLALGNCINALGEKGNKGNFVPYRDSKLTRLLKDSLGGNCRTVMIANISSSEASFEETLNTLKYANRAKNIKTHAQRNVLNVNYHISEYVALINNLRGEIQVLKGQIGAQAADQPPSFLPSTAGADGGNGPQPSSADGPRRRGSAGVEPLRSPSAGGGRSPLLHHAPRGPATPFHALRESLRSGAAGLMSSTSANAEARELVNNMRNRIVENFQERMQLRRSLIELEDQNVQNSIEVSKRQLLVVQWSETHGSVYKQGLEHNAEGLTKADFAADIADNGTPEVVEAWEECEQLRKAIMKNNGMKRNIAKRLRHNEKEAENFRNELGDKITGEDRRELMELQYQVGRLELENMELEQHRIVHESILKGKDLEIQKLKLQLAVRDKLINRQQSVLIENHLDEKVGYSQLALMEQTLMNETEFNKAMVPPSPPRNVADMFSIADEMQRKGEQDGKAGAAVAAAGAGNKIVGGNAPGIAAGRRKKSDTNAGGGAVGGAGAGRKNIPSVPRLRISDPQQQPYQQQRHASALLDSEDEEDDQDEYAMPVASDRETKLTARDRDFLEQGEWSEINSELSDNDMALGRRHATPPLNAARKQPSAAAGAKDGSGGAAAGGGGGSNVRGPRGGRHFRSAAEGDASAPSNGANQQHRPGAGGAGGSSNAHQHQHSGSAKNQSGGGHDSNAAFHIEDSDEDSHFGAGQGANNNNNMGAGAAGAGGFRKRSPRAKASHNDRLDPIPAQPAAGADDGSVGVLSGMRLTRGNSESHGSGRRDSKDSGFAPVYPLLGNNSKVDPLLAARGKKDGDWIDDSSAHGAGDNNNALDIRSKGVGSNNNNKPSNRVKHQKGGAGAGGAAAAGGGGVLSGGLSALDIASAGQNNGSGGASANDGYSQFSVYGNALNGAAVGDGYIASRPSKVKQNARPSKVNPKPLVSFSHSDPDRLGGAMAGIDLTVDGNNYGNIQQPLPQLN